MSLKVLCAFNLWECKYQGALFHLFFPYIFSAAVRQELLTGCINCTLMPCATFGLSTTNDCAALKAMNCQFYIALKWIPYHKTMKWEMSRRKTNRQCLAMGASKVMNERRRKNDYRLNTKCSNAWESYGMLSNGMFSICRTGNSTAILFLRWYDFVLRLFPFVSF